MWRAYKQLPVACETSSPLIEGAKEIRRDEYFGNGKLVRRLYKQQVMVCEPIFFHTSNRPFPSSLVPLFQNESKCETEFCMQFHFHANQSHFRKNGFALRLALNRGTRELGNDLFLS